MSEARESTDELELKKRARRRLVGAAAFATFAAVVLPMVMDDAPPPAGRNIELRIPGQDQVSSSPLARPVVEAPSAPPAPAKAAAEPPSRPSGAEIAAGSALVAASAAPRKGENPAAGRPAEGPKVAAASPRPAEGGAATRPADPPAADAARAKAILENQATAADPGAYVVLIGAFANAANVKNLQTKLGQLGIKTYTENLESAQGRKTRVRAGPFPNREAADKALDKMKRIGVGGVVAPKS